MRRCARFNQSADQICCLQLHLYHINFEGCDRAFCPSTSMTDPVGGGPPMHLVLGLRKRLSAVEFLICIFSKVFL